MLLLNINQQSSFLLAMGPCVLVSFFQYTVNGMLAC